MAIPIRRQIISILLREPVWYLAPCWTGLDVSRSSQVELGGAHLFEFFHGGFDIGRRLFHIVINSVENGPLFHDHGLHVFENDSQRVYRFGNLRDFTLPLRDCLISRAD
jgi:hypothetical protein